MVIHDCISGSSQPALLYFPLAGFLTKAIEELGSISFTGPPSALMTARDSLGVVRGGAHPARGVEPMRGDVVTHGGEGAATVQDKLSISMARFSESARSSETWDWTSATCQMSLRMVRASPMSRAKSRDVVPKRGRWLFS